MSDSSAEPHRHRAAVDLAGRVLDGRYRVEELLGAGGMGSVFRAWQITLEKRVAIKVLKPDYADREDAVKRFLREARAASKIGHPNVVEVLDFGQTEDGLVYFVMEFLAGEDLAHLVRREAPLPWRRAKRILLQIVRALKAAHAKGIVHRDVKPANCFLVQAVDDDSESVKVLDFGIAKVLATDAAITEGLTSTSQVMGTALYMAPEQAMGRGIDARTDVYALGVMAFEMITGRQPFTGATTFEVLMKRVSEPPPLLRIHRPDLGSAVEEFLQRAMARDPVARYQTMKEVEAALVAIDEDLEDRVASTDPQAGPHVEVTDDATATSARHKVQRVETVPYSEAMRVENARMVNALASGEPTQAGTRQELRPSAPVVTLAEEAPRSGSRAAPLVAGVLAGMLAVGAGVWALYLRDDPPAVVEADALPAEVAAKDRESSEAKVEPEPEPEPGPERARDLGAVTARDREAEDAVDDSKTDASDEAVVDPDTRHDPATKIEKTRAKTTTPVKREPTESDIVAKLRRRARSKCKGGAAGATVEVQFFVDASGTIGMVRGKSSNGDARVADCVVAVVEAGAFPPGAARQRNLTVPL